MRAIFSILFFSITGLIGGQVVNSIENSIEFDYDYVGSSGDEIFTIQSKDLGNNTYRLFMAKRINTGWRYYPEFDVTTKEKLNIKDIAEDKNNVYVAGNFVGSGDFQGVISYSILDKKWGFPFEFGNYVSVEALENLDGNLAIGGLFRSMNGIIVSNIGLYNTSTFITTALTANGFIGTNKMVSHLKANVNRDSLYIGGFYTKITNLNAGCLSVLDLKTKGISSLKSDSFFITGLEILGKKLFYSSFDATNKMGVFRSRLGNISTDYKVRDSLVGFTSLGFINNKLYSLVLQRRGFGRLELLQLQSDSFLPISTLNPHLKGIKQLAISSKTNVAQGFFVGIPDISEAFRLGTVDFVHKNIYTLFYWDKNGSSVFDKGLEIPLPNLKIRNIKNQYYVTSNRIGLAQWLVSNDEKSLEIEFSPFKNFLPLDKSFIINFDTLGHELVYVPLRFNISRIRDFNVKLKSNGGLQRSINRNEALTIEITNEGDDIKTADIKLTYDSKLRNLKFSRNPDVLNPGELIWQNIRLEKQESLRIQITSNAQSADYEIDKKLSFVASVLSSDDFNQNNIDSLDQTIVNPIDFSSHKFQISAYGKSQDSMSINPSDGYIDYFIRYVNNGIDTVNSIKILDTINVPLFINTVQLISESHTTYVSYPYTPNPLILPLEFNIQNVKLLPNPTKNSEIINSAGFIVLRVFYDSTIPTQYTLTNTAHISMGGANYLASNAVYANFETNSILKSLSDKDQIKVYPNPCSNILNIECKNTGQSSIILSNMAGQEVMKTKFSGQTQLQMDDLPSGQYILHIINDIGVHIQRLIVY